MAGDLGRFGGSGFSRCSTAPPVRMITKEPVWVWPSAAKVWSGTGAPSRAEVPEGAARRSSSRCLPSKRNLRRNRMKKLPRPITILMADDDPDDRQMTKEAFDESRIANDLRFVVDGVELMDYLRRSGKYGDPA